jgi:hypothetical protein
MFTWICPQCGREVPPSYNDCPDCAANPKAAAPPAPQPPARVEAPVAAAPTPPPVPRGPIVPAFTKQEAVPARAIPSWLMAVLSAAGFIVVAFGLFWVIKYFSEPGQAAPTPAAMEKPATTAPVHGKTHPLQKYIEIVGLRLTEENNKNAKARFVVVNHSGAEIADLAAQVSLSTRTAKPGDDPIGSFSFKIGSLGPYESKELSAAVATKLRVYELPDWQFLTEEIQITSPQ